MKRAIRRILRSLCLVGMLLTLNTAQASSELLSSEQFTQSFISAAHARWPDGRVEVVGPGHVRVTMKGQEKYEAFMTTPTSSIAPRLIPSSRSLLHTWHRLKVRIRLEAEKLTEKRFSPSSSPMTMSPRRLCRWPSLIRRKGLCRRSTKP